MTVTNSSEPRVVVRAHAAVGEGPAFDARTGRLIWVDITGGYLFENDLTTGAQNTVHVDTMIGAAVPRASQPGFAVAASDGYGFIIDGPLPSPHPIFRRQTTAVMTPSATRAGGSGPVATTWSSSRARVRCECGKATVHPELCTRD